MATKQHTTISRRAALAGGASIAALTGVAAGTVALTARASGGVAPDPHPAWLEQRETADVKRVRRYSRLERRYGHSGNFPAWLNTAWEKYENQSLDEHHRLTGLIADTPADTTEGMAAKAYLLWFEGEVGESGYGTRAGLSLIADLHRMATRPLTDFEADGFAKARAVFVGKTAVQEYRDLTDQVTRIAGRLGELHPQVSGQWIKS